MAGSNSAHNGISIMCFVTRKILDTEITSFVGHWPSSIRVEKNCEEASGGMKDVAVVNIFHYSFHTRGICCIKYLDGGDSKEYLRVITEKPHDSRVSVTKLECMGHVHKRMGARLRIRVTENIGTK
jgi:hypothetical protein